MTDIEIVKENNFGDNNLAKLKPLLSSPTGKNKVVSNILTK